MPGRGPQTFKKRQKEQERKERQQQKMAKRLQRKNENPGEKSPDDDILWPDAEANDTEGLRSDEEVLRSLGAHAAASDH